MRMKIIVTAIAVVAAVGSVVQGAVFTESFDSGYTPDTNLADHSDWWGRGGTASPTIAAGQGVAGSTGLSPGQKDFYWTAHPFGWNDAGFTGVVVQMDFETAVEGDLNGPYDDDRIGWTIGDTSEDSADLFCVQMDGGAIEGYWANATSGTKHTPHIVDIPALDADSWYRLTAVFTKLTDTSARIDASLTALDASGNPGAVVASGSIADTSSMESAKDSPDTKYFTASEVWASFKNYSDKAPANVDNAYLNVVPEPAAVLLLLGGAGLMLVRRRRK